MKSPPNCFLVLRTGKEGCSRKCTAMMIVKALMVLIVLLITQGGGVLVLVWCWLCGDIVRYGVGYMATTQGGWGAG